VLEEIISVFSFLSWITATDVPVAVCVWRCRFKVLFGVEMPVGPGTMVLISPTGSMWPLPNHFGHLLRVLESSSSSVVQNFYLNK